MIFFLLTVISCLLNLISIIAILQTKKSNSLFSVVIAYYSYILPIVFLTIIINHFSWLNLIKIIVLFLLNLIFIHLAIFLLQNQQNHLQNENKTI